MRALTLDYDRRTLLERDVPDPELRSSTDILFRVREVGVCGTDRELAAFRFGYPPAGAPYLVLGHEAMGEVLAVGTEVRGIMPGDFVVPTVRRACSPPCRWCGLGRRDLCLTGNYTERGIIGAHGYYAETAVDCADDLMVVPEAVAPFVVLVEPLSVVEKAVETALRLHLGGAESALILGAGTIGLLAAMALQARGLTVTISSLEEMGSPRAKLAGQCGAEYRRDIGRQFDVVIEAAGSADAASKALKALGPTGVLIVLGATEGAIPVSLLNVIVGNQTIAGSVNASPEAFHQAVEDLPRFPATVLSGMIERTGFGGWRKSIAGSGGSAPKMVHVVG